MHISSSLSCVNQKMSLCICGLSSIPVDSRLPSRVTGLLFPTPSSLRKCVGIPALTIISRSSSGSLTDKDLDHAPLSLSGTFPSSSRFCNQMCLSLLRRLHLSFLTYKTVFLIALASASRVSELHALSRQDGFIEWHENGNVSLSVQPGFLAKTQLPDVLPRPVLICRLPVDASSRSKQLLCPVRCLSAYLQTTHPCEFSDRLFVRWSKNRARFFPQILSTWIRRVIVNAYEDANQELPHMTRAAHEVRALASSLTFMSNASLF